MDPHHDEFDEVMARLEAERPTLTAFELDDLARRVQLRSKRTKSRKEPMRTRFAITSLLVIGVLLTSGAGAGMALSGQSGSGSAGSAQYATPTHQHPATQHLGASKGSSTSKGSSAKDAAPTEQSVQQIRQLATPQSGDALPFTGLVLIPLIILGVALLIVGIVLRTRSGRNPTV